LLHDFFPALFMRQFVELLHLSMVYHFHDMIDMLVDCGYEKGTTLFGYGYDFRQSNRYYPIYRFLCLLFTVVFVASIKGQPGARSSHLRRVWGRVLPLWSYVRSFSLHFCKRLFLGLEPMTSWSQGRSFTAAPGLPFPVLQVQVAVILALFGRIDKAMVGLRTKLETAYRTSGGKKVNIISHSMGGLLVRCFMAMNHDVSFCFWFRFVILFVLIENTS
jgi:hypothetical protein